MDDLSKAALDQSLPSEFSTTMTFSSTTLHADEATFGKIDFNGAQRMLHLSIASPSVDSIHNAYLNCVDTQPTFGELIDPVTVFA